VPHDATNGAAWLRAITLACRADDESLAIWLARQITAVNIPFIEPVIEPLALYTWYSRHPDLAPSRLMTRRWSPGLKLKGALHAAEIWLHRLTALVGCRGDEIEPWLGAGSCHGYDFTPLLTQADLVEEADAMDNCLDSYGPTLLANICRLFSVSRGGARIASLEIRWDFDEQKLMIYQMKGPFNYSAPLAVWKAASAWLALPENQRPHPPQVTVPVPRDEILSDYRAATAKGVPAWAAGLTLPGLVAPIDRALRHLRGARRRAP
jgi:hypothetical protein